MTDRSSLRTAFLEHVGWGEAEVSNLAGDASNRRYFRLKSGAARAVLMDAPPEKGEDVRPFVEIARFLRAQGLSAPEIMAEDPTSGFLLIEDLGDDLFARVVKAEPELEDALYGAAIDVLIALHQVEPPRDLAPYDPPFMADMAALAFDWYAKGVTGEDMLAERDAFHLAFQDALNAVPNVTEVLVQRDYHAENLLWLPMRDGIARVGLLDFQDAMAGHRAYDLVSLLQDARRDVPHAIEAKMIDRYIGGTQVDPTAFKHAYAMLGLQRNLRIIGVFARLCLRDGKPDYLKLIPRVWQHMANDLKQVNLPLVETVLLESLPCPDDTALETLRRKCGTIQAQL